jgi:hypothetical protein
MLHGLKTELASTIKRTFNLIISKYYIIPKYSILNNGKSDCITYCNVFGFLKTRFGLVICFINNPQVVNYN